MFPQFVLEGRVIDCFCFHKRSGRVLLHNPTQRTNMSPMSNHVTVAGFRGQSRSVDFAITVGFPGNARSVDVERVGERLEKGGGREKSVIAIAWGNSGSSRGANAHEKLAKPGSFGEENIAKSGFSDKVTSGSLAVQSIVFVKSS